MSVSLTDSAAERVKTFIDKRGKGVGVRLGVKTTGCSGMAYVLEFVDTLETDNDQTYQDKGITLVVSKKDLTYLEGMQLDYQKKGLNEGFEFINPNESARCGCGESFTV